MNTSLKKSITVVVLIILASLLVLSCSPLHIVNINHESDSVKIKNKAELEFAKSIWKRKSTGTYQVVYEGGSFAGVRIWEVNVKDKKFISGRFYWAGEESSVGIPIEEGEKLTIDAMLEFAFKNFDMPGYSFYKSNKNGMLIGYIYSDPDPSIDDNWGGKRIVKVSF